MIRLRAYFRLLATDTDHDRSGGSRFDLNGPLGLGRISILMFAGLLLAIPNFAYAQHFSDQLDQLILQLASDRFLQRQSAETRLIEIGQSAVPKLQTAIDPRSGLPHDARVLARRVLTRLIRNQKTERIEAFLHDPQATLPGWTAFTQAYDLAAESRQQYAGIYSDATEMIDTWQAGKPVSELGYRLVTGQYRSVTPQHIHGSLPATLFCFSEVLGRNPPPETARTIHSHWQQVTQTLARDSVVEALQKNPQHELWLAIVNRYVASLPVDYPYSLYRLRLYRAFKDQRLNNTLLKDALSKQHAVFLRANFLVELGQLGTPATIDQLETLIAEPAPVGDFLLTPATKPEQAETLLTVRLGDVALLACVQITGQAPETFGFPADAIDDAQNINLKRAGFATPAARSNAIQVWETYRNQASELANLPPRQVP